VHLQTARFIVHSHNLHAATMMVLHLEVLGFTVEVRPFDPSSIGPTRARALGARVAQWLRRWLVP
jgi:hypothetical protein